MMRMGDCMGLAARLFFNGLRFRRLRRTGRPMKPTAVSLEVTRRCMARCVMCNIWKTPKNRPELSAHDWLNLLSGDVFSDIRELDVTGGEPFLRADLPDLFAGLAALKKRRLTGLMSVALTTNGFLTRRILEQTERMLEIFRDAGVELVMVCAMDAAGPLHDRIRNLKGAWSAVHQTIQGLTSLRRRFPNLIIGLKTTILPMNVAALGDIVRYAKQRRLFTIISPRIITSGRYLNPEKEKDLRFSREDTARMIRFFQKTSGGWRFHEDQLIRFLTTGTLRKPCACGFNYLFIRSDGDLYLCPLINRPAGNVRRMAAADILASGEAACIRRRIGGFPDCRRCTEPGLERYSLPLEGLTGLALMFKMGPSAFLRYHQHTGLDKYFSAAPPSGLFSPANTATRRRKGY